MAEAENPPAFPLSTPDGHYNGSVADRGMSLRDWFAGQALPYAAFHATDSENHPMRQDFLPEEWAARMSYAFADAMIAERTKAVKHG